MDSTNGIFGSGISLSGSDTVSQIVTGVAIVVILYMSLSTAEWTYKSVKRMWKDRVELFPKTYASGSRMYTAIQNPSNALSKTITVSDNQRNGVEFSYAMFIYLSSDTFSNGNQELLHILHKGYNQSYPLMGPGIFAWGDRNALRIYMNCFNTWNNYSDIENIPVDKWFHLVVSCKGNKIHLYINGSLKTKMNLSHNTPPYQNYGDVYLFSPRKLTISPSITMSLESEENMYGQRLQNLSSLNFGGAAKGMASRVFYFSYALTYTEIQALINMQPSKEMDSTNMSMAPYLSDTWWVNKQGP